MDMKKIIGTDYNDEDNQAKFAEDPLNTATVAILGIPVDIAVGATFNYHVHITYHTKCFKGKVLSS